LILPFKLDCIIKKPEKDVCGLTRTPCALRRITRVLHVYLCPCNSDGDRFVMGSAERNREVRCMELTTEVMFFQILC
jgi:hypothetical protein